MSSLTVYVPAFKARYFKELLSCFYYQKQRPDRIIISDDTPNSEFHCLMESESYQVFQGALNIKVINGPRLGPGHNFNFIHKLIREDPSTYIHIMMDDDLIFPNFYFDHLSAIGNSGAHVSVSKRLYSLDHNIAFAEPRIPEIFSRSNTKRFNLSEEFLFKSVVPTCSNWLGEFSNAVFHSSFFKESNSLYDFEDWDVYGLADIAMFLKGSTIKGLIYHDVCMGFFRQTEGGTTTVKGRTYSFSIICWLVLGIIAFRRGYVDLQGLDQIAQFVERVYDRYYKDCHLRKLRELRATLNKKGFNIFEESFRSFWSYYLRKYSS